MSTRTGVTEMFLYLYDSAVFIHNKDLGLLLFLYTRKLHRGKEKKKAVECHKWRRLVDCKQNNAID